MLAKYVEGIINPLIGNIDSFIKDSKNFVDLDKNDKCDPNDLKVIIDIVSYFTKIPINEAAMEVVKGVTDSHTARLTEVYLRSTFFYF